MKQRVYFMDCLNIVAIMAVILLHTSGTVFSYRMDNHWLLAVLMQVMFIWAVPIFFMLSGANLLNYSERYDTKTFFKKRWARVVVPFIFWSIVWYLYTAQQNKQGLSVIKFIDNFLSGSITPTFWFFYAIIAFYLAVPIVTKLFNIQNIASLRYALNLGLLVESVIFYIISLLHIEGITFGTQIPLIGTQYFIIFMLGWFLTHTDIFQKQRRLIYILGVVAIIFMFGVTVYILQKQQALDRNAYALIGLPVLILSVAVWLWAEAIFTEKFNAKHQRLVHLLPKLSSASLGIYCIHLFVLQGLAKLLAVSDNSLLYMLVLPILTYLVSLVVILIAQKIPVVKRILP